jgi:hypothetical protein
MTSVAVSSPEGDSDRTHRRLRTGWATLLITALVFAAKAELLATLPW